MKALRQTQIRSYFFGHSSDNPLGPNSQMADFDDLNIFKIIDGKLFLPILERSVICKMLIEMLDVEQPSFRHENGLDDDDAYNASPIYERVTPSSLIQNSLLAITTAAATDKPEVIRDSSVKGYIYVSDVDEAKKKMRLLAPQPGQTPPNAIVLGSFPEEVPGLVG